MLVASAFFGRTQRVSDRITDKASSNSAEVSPDSPVFGRGFYWVKVGANERVNRVHWEPAFFECDGFNEWGLCGQDPVLSEDCFKDIKPMFIPKFD